MAFLDPKMRIMLVGMRSAVGAWMVALSLGHRPSTFLKPLTGRTWMTRFGFNLVQQHRGSVGHSGGIRSIMPTTLSRRTDTPNFTSDGPEHRAAQAEGDSGLR